MTCSRGNVKQFTSKKPFALLKRLGTTAMCSSAEFVPCRLAFVRAQLNTSVNRGV